MSKSINLTLTVKQIAKDFYNLTSVKVKKLNSYDGLNFLLHPESESKLDYSQKRNGPHILKFVPSDRSLFESHNKQVEFMIHLHSKGFCCPIPVIAANGQYIWRLTLDANSLSVLSDLLPSRESGFFMVVLLEFIPGCMLSSLHPVPYHLFSEAGKMLAILHELAKTYSGDSQPLKDFNHSSIWSLEQAADLCIYLEVIKDGQLSTIILDVVNRFKEKVLPRLSELPCGIIHGDYNDDNIIINGPSEQCLTPSSYKSDDAVNLIHGEEPHLSITGVIDFSDVSYSYFVFDIAKALSFMVITDVPDIMVTVKHFMSGYSSKRKLLQVEKDVLILCTMTSLAQNLVLALKDHSANPDNSYLLASVDDYPVALRKLFQHTEDEILAMWNL